MATWIYNDGGREAAGFKGKARDCTVCAIAIAAQLPYMDVYDALFDLNRERESPGRCSPRDGRTDRTTIRAFMDSIGWRFHPTMKIGQGCKVHLREGELPRGRIVVSLSRHLAAVIDGVIHDTHDCSRGGTRCVYGYWEKRGDDA